MRWLPVFLLLVAGTGSAWAQEKEANPRERFLEAWFSVDDPAARDAAEAVFRALAGRADLGEKLRIRAEIGIARIDELRGTLAAARERLEALIPRTKGVPALRRIVVGRLGKPRWFHGIRMIQTHSFHPRFLDLDTGGLTHNRDRHPRGGPEMELSNFLVKTELDEAFGDAVPPMSSKPWHRLRTDEGNLCWVQILSKSSQTVIRFITRVGGYGEILPAPREPFCIGYNSKIEVWWHTDAQYVKYHVSRRAGADGVWEEAKELDQPPFIDREVRAGERYGYRIVGVTKGELSGLPVALQGTVRSRGVVHGRVELKRMTNFDFLVGDTVSRGWDIRLQNVWQQAAMIQTYLNYNVFPMNLGKGVGEPLSPWDAVVTGNMQMKSGDVFLVPLRGGGVARCKLRIKRSGKRNQFVAILEYSAYGDADVFPEPPKIAAEETEEGIKIRASVQLPFRLAQAEVREILSRRGPWVIPLDENGEGIDKEASRNDLREYSVVAVDAHGRRTLAGRTVVIRMPDEPIAGDFRFKYQQGYSIEQRKMVPMGEADIFFQMGSSNSIDRIYFQSNHGIANASGALDWASSNVSEEQIFDRIAAVDAGKLALTTGYIWADRKKKGESVLILRTRHGGWAKLWIAEREKSGGNWTRRHVKVRYVYNPRSPTFDRSSAKLTDKRGIRFSDLEKIEEYSRIKKKWGSDWNRLWGQTSFRNRMLYIEPGGGDVADADEVQEVLLQEIAFKNLAMARYSFSLGRRDPPKNNMLASVWDIRWHGDHFHARLSNNDNSTITDLGRLHWTRLKHARQVVPWDGRIAFVRFGHIYLFRKISGNTVGASTLFRVTGLEPKKRTQIEWVSLQGGELRTSPALGLDAATRARMQKLLADVPNTADGVQAALGGAKAVATLNRLHSRKLPSVGRKSVSLAEFMPEVGTLTSLRFVLEGDIGNRKAAILRPSGTAYDLLLDIADAVNVEWRIDDEGRVRLKPSVLSAAEKLEIAEAEKRHLERLEAERKRKAEEERKQKLEELSEVRAALKRAIAELEARKNE